MKKLIFILMLLFLCTLVGCKKDDPEVVDNTPGISVDEQTISVNLGSEYTIDVKSKNIENPKFTYVVADNSVLSIENNVIRAIKSGSTTVTVTLVDNDALTLTITVNVVGEDTTMPVISMKDDAQKDLTISWNQTFDPLQDVVANDDIDGDITDRIEVKSDFNNQNYGAQTIVYEVSDVAGNKATFERTITVVWDYSVKFIGHAGSYYGLMNSEEAFLYAVQVLKYQALECDLKQTSDGVFVLSHDDTFGGKTIASTKYADLAKVEVTQSRNAGIPSSNGSVVNSPYTTTICTLERYLEICKEYNAKAVIEVKSSKGITNSDQSRMQALMDVIEAAGMRENTILLGSQYNCLIWTRTHGYEDIECQYLVNSCESDTVLQRCIDNNLEISINVTGDNISNSDAWLAKYKEAGIKISTYTFTQYVDYNVVQEWIDKEVDYVTCDWQLMDHLRLPKTPKEEPVYHNVTFTDEDGTVLKVARVKEGRTAAAPSDPTKEGYTFVGWSGEISNVTEDITVQATYKPIEYTITYDANLKEVKEAEWANKQEFVNEFYTDFFNWITLHVDSIPEMTVSNGTYTMSKNGKTATFSSKDDMLTIDLYDFEKTLSNLIYRPVTRNADDTCEMIPDDNYFLNSGDYFIKYQALDAWYINCINTSYTSYSKTYKPLSDGRIQIMFRFHQWAKGTNIAAFNNLPKKYEITAPEGVTYELPTSPKTYTILDTVTLPVATGSKTFVGWYTDKELTQAITVIPAGTTGHITVYAKWE